MKRICIHLKSGIAAAAAIAEIELAPTDGTVDVIIKNHESDRPLAQNRLAFMWYKQIAEQSGNGKEFERNLCKWALGFPILLARDEVEPEIHRMYEILLTTEYEQRISAMDLVEVTRLFKTKEFTEYLRSIERYAGDMGYHLTHPEDLYWEAIGATRKHKP